MRPYVGGRVGATRVDEIRATFTIPDAAIALNNVAFTGADVLLWGNDYPHDEGTWPDSRPRIEAIRAKLGPADARKVLCENAARLYGFDLDYLARHKADLPPPG